MDKKMTKWNLTESEDKIREMGELEIIGAIAILYHLLSEFDKYEHGESYVTLQDVDNDTYVSGHRLEIVDSGYTLRTDEGQLVFLDHVYMIEGNTTNLFGKACDYEEYDEDSDNNPFFTVCM